MHNHHSGALDGALCCSIPAEWRPCNALMVIATTLTVVHLQYTRSTKQQRDTHYQLVHCALSTSPGTYGSKG